MWNRRIYRKPSGSTDFWMDCPSLNTEDMIQQELQFATAKHETEVIKAKGSLKVSCREDK